VCEAGLKGPPTLKNHTLWVVCEGKATQIEQTAAAAGGETKMCTRETTAASFSIATSLSAFLKDGTVFCSCNLKKKQAKRYGILH
jgi:hypothetical protein